MESTITLAEIQNQFRTGLAGFYPGREIMQLFSFATEHLLNYGKIDIILKAHEVIPGDTAGKYDQILQLLKNWEPIQYILGYSWFYGIKFRVDRRVLIPRQETEELVDWIIKSEGGKVKTLLDIGTGSGCITVSLAVNLPGTEISACDISTDALAVAQENALLNKVPVSFFQFDMLDDRAVLPSKYDVMVSNPPYIRNLEKEFMKRNVLDYEPELALFVPDNDPLIFYKRIALLARKHLTDGGSLYLEINEHYPAEVKRLLECTGFYGIEVKHDLNGKSRIVRARK